MQLHNLVKYTLSIAIITTITACSSGPKPDEIDLDEDLKCSKNGTPAPEWVCGNVVGDDLQVAVGHSDYSRIGDNFMLQEATADGQNAMQKKVYNYIIHKLESFSRAMGGSMAKLIDAEASSIATTISEDKKEDYKQIKFWQNEKDSSIEVLMAIQEKNINKDVVEMVLIAIKKDAATYKEFEENDGEDKLEDLFDLD